MKSKMGYNKAQEGCSDVTFHSSLVCSESKCNILWLLYALSLLVNQTCKMVCYTEGKWPLETVR